MGRNTPGVATPVCKRYETCEIQILTALFSFSVVEALHGLIFEFGDQLFPKAKGMRNRKSAFKSFRGITINDELRKNVPNFTSVATGRYKSVRLEMDWWSR